MPDAGGEELDGGFVGRFAGSVIYHAIVIIPPDECTVACPNTFRTSGLSELL